MSFLELALCFCGFNWKPKRQPKPSCKCFKLAGIRSQHVPRVVSFFFWKPQEKIPDTPNDTGCPFAGSRDRKKDSPISGLSVHLVVTVVRFPGPITSNRRIVESKASSFAIVDSSPTEGTTRGTHKNMRPKYPKHP